MTKGLRYMKWRIVSLLSELFILPFIVRLYVFFMYSFGKCITGDLPVIHCKVHYPDLFDNQARYKRSAGGYDNHFIKALYHILNIDGIVRIVLGQDQTSGQIVNTNRLNLFIGVYAELFARRVGVNRYILNFLFEFAL